MKTKKAPAVDLETIIPILVGVWRRFNKLSGPPDALQTREFRGVVAAIKILQERFDEGKSLIGQNYFDRRELLSAYLLYPWVVHYQQALSLIGELPSPPKRVLDLCSGPAPLAFAALRHGAQDVYATDQNQTALELGAEICGKYGMPLTIRQWNCTRGKLPIQGKFDLITLGYALEELFPSNKKNWVQDQNQFLQHIIQEYLSPQGFLLVVESSFIEPNRRLLQSRDHLVAHGVPVQAPCVWKGECPALKMQNSPCYAQREFEKPFLIKEIQRACSINLSSLKMSYIIFRHPEAGWPQLPDRPLYRVISPPVETFQGKRFYLCGTDGKKSLDSPIKEHSADTRAFEYLKRGELISVENAMIKENALDIVKGTKITVEAACGKPLMGTKEEDF